MARPMHPLKRLRKMLQEVRQLRVDIEYWNRTRTDCEPFDIGKDVIWENFLERLIHAWGTPEFNRLMDELPERASEYATVER